MPTVRPASTADLATIRELAYRIWPVAYSSILSPEQLQYMLERFYALPSLAEQMGANHRFLLLEDGGIPQGFASYSPAEAPGQWKLQKLYVLPGQQGKGLGRTLLQVVESAIREVGASALILNVNRHNPALNFYEKLGFRIAREEDISIGEGYFMNDYVLEKHIEAE
jgi:GNAT superfamily N-acetyltransferase